MQDPPAIRQDAHDFAAGGGRMGELVTSKDWSDTRLGAVEHWPQSLRTAVSLCLASNFPISIAWGPHRNQIYNDGYWPICGAKHPHSMGQDFKECWFSAWPQIGPAFERAQAGETSFLENVRMFLDRNGYLEETFFTFSFSPIRDETGGVGGLFHPVTETTAVMLSERRTAALRDLAARTAKATSVEDACSSASDVLAAHDLDLPFSLIYLLSDDGREARLVGTSGSGLDASARPDVVALDAAEDPSRGWPLARVATTAAGEIVDDLARRFADLSCGPYPEPPPSALVLPLVRPGSSRPAGMLVAATSSRLPLDVEYRAFLTLVAAHVGAAIANARAYEDERARAEALAELDRAKTAFFSNVSHEFRTPLTLMLGPLEEMLARPEGEPADRAQLETTHRNALRLLRLVNSLLDFSRLEAGRVEAVYEPTDLATLTADLASLFRSAVERVGLRLVVDCPPLPEPVYVDREKWEKVVLNLLSNAVKFTFEGEIEVSVRAREGAAELRVRDTGVGVPSAELPRLFERFRRVAGARSRSHEGSGIGLSLVHELVTLHGGTVTVESEVDRGTTFTVTIPLGSGHFAPELVRESATRAEAGPAGVAYVQEASRWVADEPDADPSPARRDAPAASARVLVADDNADMRDYLRRLLEGTHEVETVSDGALALERALASVPDLIVSDVMMPGLDGFELLRALRADPRTRDVPFVLVSARAGEEARVEGLRAGADDYLVKPFAAEELRAKVDSTLRLTSARLRERDRFFNLSLDLLCVAGLDGAIRRANARFSETLGWDDRELLGRPIFELVHPEDRGATAAVLEGLRAGEPALSFENRLRRRDGSYAWLSWSVRPLVEEGVAYCVARDVTRRKRDEEALALALERERHAREVAEGASTLKDEFLATVSHELRTPLNAILGWSRIICSERGRGMLERGLATIERNAVVQAQLVEDLLDVSRVVSGQMRLTVESVDLSTIIRAAADSARPAASAKGVRLVIALDADAGPATGDPRRLQQVVWNLLSNAIKFTPKGGRVRVTLRRVDSHLEIVVTDTGQGIEPDFLPYVFDRFRQADGSTTRTQGGLGIGLALVRQLTELHGGTVSAASDGAGSGSTFRVSIPLAAVRAPSAVDDRDTATGASEPSFAAELVGMRILVVDDEPDAAELLEVVLGSREAAVRTANSASDAIELLDEWEPNVLVSDIGMPGDDGYALIRRVRELASERVRNIPAVAVTAYARAEDRVKVLSAGYQAHLTKPVDPVELVAVVASLGRSHIEALE